MPKRKPKDKDRSPDLPQNWIQRHIERLNMFAFTDSIALTKWHYRRAELIGPGQYKYIDSEWQNIQVGDQWGGPDITTFFRKTVTIPESHADPTAFLDIDMDGGETQLRINGCLYQGLDYYRSLVPIGEYAEAGRELELTLEAFVINYPYDERRQDERDYHRFARANLVRRDPIVETAVHDLRFVFNAYMSYWHNDDNLELEEFLRHHLEEACQLIGPRLNSQEEAQHAAFSVSENLRQHLFESDVFLRDGMINICAHSHLDLVYLWPIKETYRKNGRTTSNMLSLLREFPEFIYSQSQPYLYEMLKKHYPDLFEEVRHYIHEGRWEVIGALYVEPDGNLLGPESWVRQILFGKRFLREELGVDSAICWLPDVFGILYTLPQILKKGDIDYCMTNKLNIWNDTNIFPHDTFRWRGPDGSEVITHFPSSHFAQDFNFDNLRRHWSDFREKQTIKETLFIYGWGDGGGGPTREMVEASSRAKKFPGLPKTQIMLTEHFFQNLNKKVTQMPVWDNELYLEAHRGTYTSKGDLKRQNRKAELLYRDVEIISAFASLYGGPRIQERLNEGWKHILLNQFHDTLPGTHVQAVVPDIQEDYDRAFSIGAAIYDEVCGYLAQNLEDEAANQFDLMLLNTISWKSNRLLHTMMHKEAKSLRLADGTKVPVQHYDEQSWFRVPLPSMGWTLGVFEVGETAVNPNAATFDNTVIETAFYHITLGQNGELTQIYDKEAARDVLEGPGNQFQFFEDDPGKKFSAWDIAYHFERYTYPVVQTSRWQLKENGPYFAVFSSQWQMLNSTIEQEMWLYTDNRRIDFKTSVDLRDSQKLLKVAFPLSIRARSATYDLPFGHIERPTHRNTSWERAKFEVCGHKWADMSEGNYGTALLNDCKYGYDAHENVLRLSLVRSPIRPTPQSDIGLHPFTYSLLPHMGNWRQAHVDRRAYELNIPATAVSIPKEVNVPSHLTVPGTSSLVDIASDSIIVEVLKQAEDGNGLILRTFDSHGNRSKPLFYFGKILDTVSETNLLEEQPEKVPMVDKRSFVAHHKPFEIKTHRLKFQTGREKE